MRPQLAGLVLAAGRGQRLRPLTDTTPKPLLPIGTTTLLDAMLDRLNSVVPVSPATMAVNAHWLASQVVAHVAGRAHLSVEEPEPLGTAGAVAAITAWRAGRDLLVANGDAYLDGELDLPGFVDGWDRARPRLLVVPDAERPDFEGRWRFAGISLLPAGLAEPLAAVPSGLYEAVWRQARLDLVRPRPASSTVGRRRTTDGPATWQPGVVTPLTRMIRTSEGGAPRVHGYFGGYGLVGLLGVVGVLFVMTGLAANRLLRPAVPTPGKLLTYESGVDPVGDGWAQTQVRYYVFVFLYVVFAVDSVFLFPWATVFAAPGFGTASLVEMFVFLGFLTVGLLYAAKRGVLTWV